MSFFRLIRPTYMVVAVLLVAGLFVGTRGERAELADPELVHSCASPCWHRMPNDGAEWKATVTYVQIYPGGNLREVGRFRARLCNYTGSVGGWKPIRAQMRIAGHWFDDGQFLGIASLATTPGTVGVGQCALTNWSPWTNLGLGANMPGIAVSNGGVALRAAISSHP